MSKKKLVDYFLCLDWQINGQCVPYVEYVMASGYSIPCFIFPLCLDSLDEDVSLASTVPTVKSELLPSPLINIDVEYQDDPFQCATYAHDIFEYLKTREVSFSKIDYP